MHEKRSAPTVGTEKSGTAAKDRPNKVKATGELHGAHGAEAVIVPAEVADAPGTPRGGVAAPSGPAAMHNGAFSTPRGAFAAPGDARASSQPAGANGGQAQRAKARPRSKRLDPAEQAYRAAVLRDIAARERAEGPHVARAHADRARQFMPFAALKGYHEMAQEQEAVREPRHDMTEERALALSKEVAGLRKGDVVRVVHYEGSAYCTAVGAVAEVDEAFRSLTVVKRRIAFDDVLSIERLQ